MNRWAFQTIPVIVRLIELVTDMKEIYMTKKSLSFLMMIGVSCILMSCAVSNYIPEGSLPLGTYEGHADEISQNIGRIRVQIYQTETGDKLFKGFFETSRGVAIDFKGKLKGTTLKGEFDSGRGDVSGQLSPDGSQITGTYYFTKSKSTGTWQAERK